MTVAVAPALVRFVGSVSQRQRVGLRALKARPGQPFRAMTRSIKERQLKQAWALLDLS